MHLAFAQASQDNGISSYGSGSSEPTSPVRHTAAQRIHSLQPTTSQPPQILLQDVISVLLGMPPSHTSSANTRVMWKAATVLMRSTRPSKSDRSCMEIGLGPLGGMSSPVSRYALRYVDLRRPRRCFLSLSTLAIPSLRTVPSILCASSFKFRHLPNRSGSHPAPAPVPTLPTSRTCTFPAPRALLRFHVDSPRWSYPRAPLDTSGEDIVELDYADTSAVSDVDAFGRCLLDGRNGVKHSKRDRERGRDETERSWDIPRKNITPEPDTGLSHAPAILGRPSRPQAHLAIGGARWSAAASSSPSPHSQSGTGSSAKPSQPNNSASPRW